MARFTLPTTQAAGPLLNAAVGVSDPRRQALEDEDEDVPGSVTVQALVDTGASCTCVDPKVLSQLDLDPTGTVEVHTPTSGDELEVKDQYDIGLLIPGSDQSQQPLYLDTVPVVGADLLDRQGYEVLIGRDILQNCILVYNGPTGIFTLAF